MSAADPLRLAFILPFLFRYRRGIERAAVGLANALVQAGQSVTFFAWRHPGGNSWPELDARVRIRAVPYLRYWQAGWAARYYRAWLRREPFDVLNLFFAGYGEAAALRPSRLSQPFKTVFIAGYPYAQAPHRYQEFNQLGLSPRLDGILVKHPSYQADAARFFNQPAGLLPNGVDAQYFHPPTALKPALKATLGLQPDAPVLLSVAALEARKGLSSILEALPLARPAFQFVVAGDGPQKAALIHQAASLGLTDRVHWLGNLADLRPWYQAADVFALYAEGEGLPNALLEAWASGLPVIAADTPPFQELLAGGRGHLARPRDPAALAAALTGLWHQPQERAALAQRGRSEALANYSWEPIARGYLQFIQNLADTPAK